MEILSFSEIYYIAIGVTKTRNITLHNSGFDEEDSDYRIVIGDHISYRYEIIQTLGSGSFGRVVKVFDHKEKRYLALKIIKNKPKFHEQAREEIEILHYLQRRNLDRSFCVIHLQDSFMFRNHTVLVI